MHPARVDAVNRNVNRNPNRRGPMTHHHHEEKPSEKSDRGRKPGQSDARTAAEPERPPTIQELEGQAVHEQEDPPKAEGDRDEAEEA